MVLNPSRGLYPLARPRVGFSRRELPNGPAKKIESHLSLIGLERVGDSRLTWF